VYTRLRLAPMTTGCEAILLECEFIQETGLSDMDIAQKEWLAIVRHSPLHARLCASQSRFLNSLEDLAHSGPLHTFTEVQPCSSPAQAFISEVLL
jgi:hypothetical protein